MKVFDVIIFFFKDNSMLVRDTKLCQSYWFLKTQNSQKKLICTERILIDYETRINLTNLVEINGSLKL